MTATRSPSTAPLCRTPCRATAPTVAKAASSRAYLVGHVHGESARHVDHLSVVGEVSATAGHAVTDLETPGQFADAGDYAGAAVAQRIQFLQPGLHGAVGGEEAIAAYLGHHLSHLVGPAARFAHQALLAEVYLGALCAGAYERPSGVHKESMRSQGGRRHLEHLDAAVLDRLSHLLHRAPPRLKLLGAASALPATPQLPPHCIPQGLP